MYIARRIREQFQRSTNISFARVIFLHSSASLLAFIFRLLSLSFPGTVVLFISFPTFLWSDEIKGETSTFFVNRASPTPVFRDYIKTFLRTGYFFTADCVMWWKYKWFISSQLLLVENFTRPNVLKSFLARSPMSSSWLTIFTRNSRTRSQNK